MKDRTVPCAYYICAHAACGKGMQDVTLKKCKNCAKYRARKAGRREEPAALKKQKDRERHDNWKKWME